MSKLDPSGESLESILASIRRSLAEQSTDVLAEDAPQPPAILDTLGAVVPGEDDAPPRFLGKSEPHAPQQAEVPLPPEAPPRTDRAFAGLDDPPPPASISATFSRLDGPPPAPMSAAAAPAPQPEEAPKDPLWFLTRGSKDKQEGIPAPAASVPLPPATAQPAPAQPASASIAQPKPALQEIVRGPLPPFFGSNPEAANVEVAPTPPLPVPMPGAAAIPPAAPPPADAVLLAETEPPRSIALDAAPRAPAAPAGPTAPTASEAPHAGGRANAFPVPPAVDSASLPPSGAAQLQGLEAMVADLLRPMLRRWLDENMPRLVSAALKAEAENLPKRDPKTP